nr:hypothetical protein GCM10020093_086560 [Planobispora longispora]
MRSVSGRPIASRAGQPKVVSALLFQSVTTPSASKPKKGSRAVAMIERVRSCWAWSAAVALSRSVMIAATSMLVAISTMV